MGGEGSGWAVGMGVDPYLSLTASHKLSGKSSPFGAAAPLIDNGIACSAARLRTTIQRLGDQLKARDTPSFHIKSSRRIASKPTILRRNEAISKPRCVLPPKMQSLFQTGLIIKLQFS